MKTQRLLVTVLALLLFTSTASFAATIKTDLNRERLRGPVNSVLVEIAQIKKRDGKSVEDPRMPWLSRVYNRQGNRIEEDQLYNNISLNFKSRFTFDDMGKLKEGVEYDANGKVSFTWTYTHDPEKNTIEERRFQPDGKRFSSVTYYYDSQGNLIEERDFPPHTKNFFKWVFRYDKNGKKAQESYYLVHPDRRTGQIKTILNFKSEFFYDKEETLVEEIRSDGTGEVEWDKHYKYEYDKFGNWVVQKAFQALDPSEKRKLEPSGLTYRTITYL